MDVRIAVDVRAHVYVRAHFYVLTHAYVCAHTHAHIHVHAHVYVNAHLHLRSRRKQTPIMASAPTSIQCLQKDLNTYARIARVESHYPFTSTCLRSHIIPWGLTINIHPCVPKSPGWEPAARLHKQWAQIIRRATKGSLPH